MGTTAKIEGNGNIVIQKVDGSTITINPLIPEEVRMAFIEHQQLIADLPHNIISLLMEKNTAEPPVIGAKVYLGLDFLFTDMGVAGVSLTVQVTNLTKEIRFFNSPFFKLSVPIEGTADTFIMTNVIGESVKFPRKMEYGEVISQTYMINSANISMFKALLERRLDVVLTVYVSTTLGEMYESNKYPVSEIVKQERHVR